LSFLRSIFFSTPLIGISTIILGTMSLTASLFDPSGNAMHWFARLWGRFLLAVSFIHVRGEGLEKIDPHATYVFVANHSSYMDIPALLSQLSNQYRFFAKKELFQVPFMGYHLTRAGHLPVDRSSVRSSLKSMNEAVRLVKDRHISLILFPERGRSPERMREFAEGAAYIAIKAGVPAVPVAIVGARKILPMGANHIRSGEIQVCVGDPIATADLKPADRTELNRKLYREVARMAGESPEPDIAAAAATDLL
jgi:1-acyl-sn-glycerol-3-phosphate acyltransferase